MCRKVIILTLLIIAGCKEEDPAPIISRFEISIENLSRTTQQLEDLRKEKDLFVKLLDDFERQKRDGSTFLSFIEIIQQDQTFTEWHMDITQREKDLSIEHAMNVLAAHREIQKRNSGETVNP